MVCVAARYVFILVLVFSQMIVLIRRNFSKHRGSEGVSNRLVRDILNLNFYAMLYFQKHTLQLRSALACWYKDCDNGMYTKRSY